MLQGSGTAVRIQKAGPSLVFKGAMAEAKCASGQSALGCSVFQLFPDSNGVKPNADLTGCLAQSGAPVYPDPTERSGAYAYSACCSATGALECMTVVSPASGLRAGKAVKSVCPDGYTMTGCNVFAADGKPAGAKIILPRRTNKDTCKVYLGARLPRGSTGVKAIATCCRIAP